MSGPHTLHLFVPADRPERFAKACASGADAVIIDLEDAVAPPAKEMARAGLKNALAGLVSDAAILLRVNARATPWHGDDIRVAAELPIAGVMLPKVETSAEIDDLRPRLPGKSVVALIESANGLAAAAQIAGAADQIAFGSVDFASDLGSAHSREALLFARSQIVMAARVAGQPPPIDGVTLSIKDDAATESDARYALSLGFGGKLLIHPSQVAPARRGLAPSEVEKAWAERILGVARDGSAVQVEGEMVDAPVLARARRILAHRG